MRDPVLHHRANDFMVYFRQGICFGVLRYRDAGMVLLCSSPGSEAWDVCMQGTRGGGGELEGDFHGTACPGAGASSRAAEGWAAARSSHGHIEQGIICPKSESCCCLSSLFSQRFCLAFFLGV